jgi:hypothetical protein
LKREEEKSTMDWLEEEGTKEKDEEAKRKNFRIHRAM